MRGLNFGLFTVTIRFGFDRPDRRKKPIVGRDGASIGAGKHDDAVLVLTSQTENLRFGIYPVSQECGVRCSEIRHSRVVIDWRCRLLLLRRWGKAWIGRDTGVA